MRTLLALALGFGYGLLVLVVDVALIGYGPGTKGGSWAVTWLAESLSFVPLVLLLRAMKCRSVTGIVAIFLGFVAFTLPFSLFAVFFNQQYGVFGDFFASFQSGGCAVVVAAWLCLSLLRLRDRPARASIHEEGGDPAVRDP